MLILIVIILAIIEIACPDLFSGLITLIFITLIVGIVGIVGFIITEIKNGGSSSHSSRSLSESERNEWKYALGKIDREEYLREKKRLKLMGK